MKALDVYRGYGKEMEKRLRLKTFPIAVKLLASESEIPQGAMRPLEDTGKHLCLCQAYQLSRREGRTVAMLKEDNWCFEPVVGYGIGEPPEFFLQGHNRFPQDVASLEAGKHFAEEFPRLEVGKSIGVMSAPLRETEFEPDFVIIYCDSAQLSLLLLAGEHKDGYSLKCSLSAHAACVYAVVPSATTGNFQVAVPCRGDHYYAMAGDDEMIFSTPNARLEELMTGLRFVNSSGSKLPRGYAFMPERQLTESYEKIGQMMGFVPAEELPIS